MNRVNSNSYAPKVRKGWHSDYIARGYLLCKGQAIALAEKGVTP